MEPRRTRLTSEVETGKASKREGAAVCGDMRGSAVRRVQECVHRAVRDMCVKVRVDGGIRLPEMGRDRRRRSALWCAACFPRPFLASRRCPLRVVSRTDGQRKASVRGWRQPSLVSQQRGGGLDDAGWSRLARCGGAITKVSNDGTSSSITSFFQQKPRTVLARPNIARTHSRLSKGVGSHSLSLN